MIAVPDGAKEESGTDPGVCSKAFSLFDGKERHIKAIEVLLTKVL